MNGIPESELADGRLISAMTVSRAEAWMRGARKSRRTRKSSRARQGASKTAGGLVVDSEGAAFGTAVIGPRRRALIIPANTIARVAPVLETQGRVPRGYLGLGLRPVRLDTTSEIGAMAMHVDVDGPGAKAGVHQGHHRNMGWAPVASIASLLRGLGADSVGRAIVVGVRRGGAPLSLNLTIGERPAA